ncbi:adenosylcobinamide-GDP ribazoletransferase [Asaia krungthepensis]|uniref:Adenosylcobinamide-GDP ribazoletransferase n=1 Tax=Asaia krungthepensis NRIC 0535 TaxID=1307925 RepID=A0ABQ0Q1D4_9PROT|nr:adenosylcobinamide-GDP ribazoletransferase [Asaia krungthepensis]GBQ86752.1 cobalamin synthase [Asaia krungthepensis NRIC 0535]
MTILRADFAAGLSLLTRLPTAWLYDPRSPIELTRSSWCWPLLGGGIGAATGSMMVLCIWLGMPAIVATGWAIVLQLFLTGALHEDGFADTIDGFFGGRTAERRLEIMRDSRIGSYGGLALSVVMLLRAGTMTTLAAQPLHIVSILATAGAFSRLSLMLPLLWLRPARADGLAHELRHLPARCLLVAIFFTALIASSLSLLGALSLFLAACLATLGLCSVAYRLVGGYTGDVLGATAIITELVVLTGASLHGFDKLPF